MSLCFLCSQGCPTQICIVACCVMAEPSSIAYLCLTDKNATYPGSRSLAITQSLWINKRQNFPIVLLAFPESRRSHAASDVSRAHVIACILHIYPSNFLSFSLPTCRTTWEALGPFCRLVVNRRFGIQRPTQITKYLACKAVGLSRSRMAANRGRADSEVTEVQFNLTSIIQLCCFGALKHCSFCRKTVLHQAANTLGGVAQCNSQIDLIMILFY